MPRSRSRSMASSTCASISRACSAPVSSRKRSARVDLPWSMCAMIEKFRMCAWSIRFRTLNYTVLPSSSVRNTFEEIDDAGLERILGADHQQASLLDQLFEDV